MFFVSANYHCAKMTSVIVFTARKRSMGQGNIFIKVCQEFCSLGGGGGIPACLAGHMTNQQYISSYTAVGSQLMWRQHTGNIKCMMG